MTRDFARTTSATGSAGTTSNAERLGVVNATLCGPVFPPLPPEAPHDPRLYRRGDGEAAGVG
jgi:hypothetical protein